MFICELGERRIQLLYSPPQITVGGFSHLESLEQVLLIIPENRPIWDFFPGLWVKGIQAVYQTLFGLKIH